MSTCKASTIVKHSEHVVKVKDEFACLEEDTLTKAGQLPKHLRKHVFFHRGKPKNDSSKINTSMCVLHAEDTQTIIGDLHGKLEDEETTVGLKRVQHRNEVKIGCAHRIMNKKHMQEWTDCLTRLLSTALSFKILISFQERKINDSTHNKANRGPSLKTMTRNKKKHDSAC